MTEAPGNEVSRGTSGGKRGEELEMADRQRLGVNNEENEYSPR